MGFDDIPFSNYTNPPLTTVHQPAFEKGVRAAELLIKLLETHEPQEFSHSSDGNGRSQIHCLCKKVKQECQPLNTAITPAVLPMTSLYKGMRVLFLENDLLRVGILLDKGADIFQLLHKPTDTDFLWRSPQGLETARSIRSDARILRRSISEFVSRRLAGDPAGWGTR